MMSIIHKYALKTLLICGLFFITANCFAMTVQVFADNEHPVVIGQPSKNIEVSYYNLDQLKSVLNKINADIGDQNTAVTAGQVKTVIQRYKTQMKEATAGVRYVHQYNITEIPTIVFDNGIYQIKGQTDLPTAIGEYRVWQRQQKYKK